MSSRAQGARRLQQPLAVADESDARRLELRPPALQAEVRGDRDPISDGPESRGVVRAELLVPVGDHFREVQLEAFTFANPIAMPS